MTHVEFFPDYPLSELPAIPEGWTIAHGRHDCAPIYWTRGERFTVVIDYLDRNKREFPDAPRFSVHLEGPDGGHIIDTDDWQAVLAAIGNEA